MLKKILAIFLCALMLLSVISACAKGNDDDNNDNSNDNSNNENNQSQQGNVNNDIEGTHSSAEAGAKPEGWKETDATESIHVTLTASLNTLEAFSVSGNQTTSMIYECLTDPLIKKDEEGNYIPWLAEEYEVAEDNMSATFKIREGIYYTNGNEVEAKDMVFRFEDIRDSERYPDSFAKNWRNYIDTVELLDEWTIKLNFSQIMPEFWGQINTVYFSPIDVDVWNEIGPDEYWKNPAGTGPYTIKSWDPANTKIVLEIRQDEHGYFGYELEDSWTNVKTITMEYSPEAQTRLASLRTGETDIIDIIPTTDVEALISEGFTVEKAMPTTERFVQFACGEGDVFNDPNLREAFSLCLDRELLGETIMNGYAEAISWPAREGQYGYTDNPPAKYEYNLERAKELVEASDYNGEELTMIGTVTYVPETSELMVAIQSLAAEAGFNIAVRTCEAAIYDEMRSAREFDLCLANIGGGSDNWYKTVNNVIGNDRFNSGTTDQVMIEAALETGGTVDPDTLQGLYTTVYTQLLTTYDGLTLLYWPIDCAAYNSRITGITHRYSNYVFVSRVVVVDADGNPV